MKKNLFMLALLLATSVALAVPISTHTEPFIMEPTQHLVALVMSGEPKHRVDANGIPRVYYYRQRKAHDNPVYVCMYAYGYYDLFQETDRYGFFLDHYIFAPLQVEHRREYRQYFLNCADWLVEKLQRREDGERTFHVWDYDFAWPVYGLQPGWVSGMAQGCGIEVLTLAYQQTGDETYLRAARKALQAFFIPVSQGGVTIKDTDEHWWYEEYADPCGVESRVLNGMEHVLLAIQTYYEATHDQNAALLLKKGLASLKHELPKYDTGQWTYYSQTGQIATPKYQQINVSATREVGEVFGDHEFVRMAAKWHPYRAGFFVRNFVWQRPLPFFTLLFALNVVGTAVSLAGIAWAGERLMRRFAKVRPRGKTPAIAATRP